MGLKLLSSIYVEQHFMCSNKFHLFIFQLAQGINIFEKELSSVYGYFFIFLFEDPKKLLFDETFLHIILDPGVGG